MTTEGDTGIPEDSRHPPCHANSVPAFGEFVGVWISAFGEFVGVWISYKGEFSLQNVGGISPAYTAPRQ